MDLPPIPGDYATGTVGAVLQATAHLPATVDQFLPEDTHHTLAQDVSSPTWVEVLASLDETQRLHLVTALAQTVTVAKALEIIANSERLGLVAQETGLAGYILSETLDDPWYSSWAQVVPELTDQEQIYLGFWDPWLAALVESTMTPRQPTPQSQGDNDPSHHQQQEQQHDEALGVGIDPGVPEGVPKEAVTAIVEAARETPGDEFIQRIWAISPHLGSLAQYILSPTTQPPNVTTEKASSLTNLPTDIWEHILKSLTSVAHQARLKEVSQKLYRVVSRYQLPQSGELEFPFVLDKPFRGTTLPYLTVYHPEHMPEVAIKTVENSGKKNLGLIIQCDISAWQGYVTPLIESKHIQVIIKSNGVLAELNPSHYAKTLITDYEENLPHPIEGGALVDGGTLNELLKGYCLIKSGTAKNSRGGILILNGEHARVENVYPKSIVTFFAGKIEIVHGGEIEGRGDNGKTIEQVKGGTLSVGDTKILSFLNGTATIWGPTEIHGLVAGTIYIAGAKPNVYLAVPYSEVTQENFAIVPRGVVSHPDFEDGSLYFCSLDHTLEIYVRSDISTEDIGIYSSDGARISGPLPLKEKEQEISPADKAWLEQQKWRDAATAARKEEPPPPPSRPAPPIPDR